jgi:hypothetical protein
MCGMGLQHKYSFFCGSSNGGHLDGFYTGAAFLAVVGHCMSL